jgi:hypothetical protein
VGTPPRKNTSCSWIFFSEGISSTFVQQANEQTSEVRTKERPQAIRKDIKYLSISKK